MTLPSADLLHRYDRPGPRYTSYPTAVEFHDGVGRETYERHLARAARRTGQPLSLYVHLPFCRERCTYCGCNVVVTRRREVERRYRAFLGREIREVADQLGPRRGVRQLHWGGGTPSYMRPTEMRGLFGVLTDHFQIEPGAEVAIEVDPRVTSAEHLAVLRELGFNRLSMGVQDFTPEVQARVNRIQPFELTAALMGSARRLGFDSINIDLIYGLPLQTPATFERTLEQVLALRPERVASYSYAHVPWVKGQQRRIELEELPAPAVKLQLLERVGTAFTSAGYRPIGMDHFAVPEDELARAAENGTLWRNFMGYTVRHAPDTVAFGLSAIGDVAGAYIQNEKKLNRYEAAVDATGLAACRGYVLDASDRLRRHLITALMANLRVEHAVVERAFDIDFSETFARELAALEPLEADGLVRREPERLVVTSAGRFFLRNVCMVFDTYLERHGSGGRTFSRTV